MAKIQVSYNCGCGFRTENLAEAVIHSDTTNHSLTVVGTITKDQKQDKVGAFVSKKTAIRLAEAMMTPIE